MHHLYAWGFSPFFLSQLDTNALDPVTGLPSVGRVLHTAHGLLTVAAPAIRTVTLSGALRAAGPVERPLVGDWVEVDGEGRVTGVLTRRSLLQRRDPAFRGPRGTAEGRREGGVQPLAANVDTVFVTTSLNLDLNVRRVERFVALVRAAGADPVVVLTKADLVPDAGPSIAALRAVGVPIVVTAGADGEVEALGPWLGVGRTVAFVGASGVGKSTLVNRLLGADVEAVSAIRAFDDRGRHTTTDRHLHRAPDGTLLLDMPGVREVGLVGDEDVGDDVFPEVEALAEACRWRDCAHGGEVGCAVRAALDDGSLDAGRWEAYQKLQRELAWAKRADDPVAQRAARQVWKARTQAARERTRR